MGLVMLPMIGLVAISGIFYPITAMPGWLQGVAQVFPIYWLGLGMRSAFLPDALAAVELGHSWRHLETFGVLGLWAVARPGAGADRSCAGWRAASPARRWPPAARGPCTRVS